MLARLSDGAERSYADRWERTIAALGAAGRSSARWQIDHRIGELSAIGLAGTVAPAVSGVIPVEAAKLLDIGPVSRPLRRLLHGQEILGEQTATPTPPSSISIAPPASCA